MPAIQLARLRRQAADLSESFSQPAAFRRQLLDLFEFYANRTHRPSQRGAPDPAIKTYNVAEPVLRHIQREIEPHIKADPLSSLILAEALWAEPVLECRQMAINLLGRTPAKSLERVLDLAQSWNEDNREDLLIEALARDGLAYVRQNNQSLLLQYFEDWFSSGSQRAKILGLYALAFLVTETKFENLPVLFRLVGIALVNPPSEMYPYLLSLINTMARHTPQETAYFLQQTLVQSNHPSIAWLIRHSLDKFPTEQRSALRAAMKR